MFDSQDENWLDGWCDRSLEVLKNWDDWAARIRQATMGSNAQTLELLVQQGELLTRHLGSLMNERRQVCESRSISSLRYLVNEKSPRRSDFLTKIKAIEALSVRVRQNCAAHWVSAKQTAKFIDDLLFVFRSGQKGRATYSSDEEEMFQGGVVLDSTA